MTLITETYILHNKHRPSGRHVIRLLYWIALWTDAPFLLSHSPSLSFSNVLPGFVVWACFALKSITSVGNRELEWTECIPLLVYCKISACACVTLYLSRSDADFLSACLCLSLCRERYQSLDPVVSDETEPMWRDTDDQYLTCALCSLQGGAFRTFESPKNTHKKFWHHLQVKASVPLALENNPNALWF